jgi:hypothetical protein
MFEATFAFDEVRLQPVEPEGGVVEEAQGSAAGGESPVA